MVFECIHLKMGKLEWHFGGRSSSRRATTDRPRRRDRPSLPSCMSTLFHFFDFRSSHFTHIVFDNHHSSSFDLSNHRPPLPKASHHGFEAPRNSLELDEDPISCLRNKEENLQLQMGLQIKTRNCSTKLSKARSEKQLPNNDHIIALESPSAKTPNLLARLMGLDNLPQTSSSCSYCRGPTLGTRSLPESPRVSSARLSDVDYHHRHLSLQINPEKENIVICDGQIKREKVNVRKKVVLVDITNNNKRIELEKQEVLSPSQSKVGKSSKKLMKTTVNELSRSRIVLKNQEVVSKKQKLIPMSMKIPKSSAREGETFDCPRSNNLLNNLNHSTIFPIKKEPSSATKVPLEQPHSYPKGKAKPTAGDGRGRNTVDSTTTTHGGSAEFKHIKTIQSSHNNSNWVIPSTFHHLETTATATAAVEEQRRNRRLVLHLVEYSVGGEIVNKSWHVRRGMKGRELGEEVKKKKKEFPRAKSEVVEIKDLEKSKRIMAEETEGIVKLIELHILDSLLRETIALISFPPKHYRFTNF